MKVAIVTPSVLETDGQGRVNFEIVRRLVDRGITFTLVVMRISPKLEHHPNISVIRYPVAPLPALLRTTFFGLLTERWLRRNRHTFEVIQIDGATAIASSDINPSHFVHTAWQKAARNVESGRPLWYLAYHRFLSIKNSWAEKRAYAAATIVVAVSTRIRSDLIEIGVRPEKIAVVPLGVDTETFHPGLANRSAYGLPEKRFVIAFAGDMTTPRKNLDSVLAAVERIPNVHLAVIGSTNKNRYPEIVRRMGIADRVSFLGFRTDLPDVFRCCDAFAFPSRYEPFGLVVLEALASGLPVITAQTTGASDVVTSSCGFVIKDPNDIEAISRAIESIAFDPARLAAMKIAARSEALEHSWDRVADRIERLYRSAALNRNETVPR